MAWSRALFRRFYLAFPPARDHPCMTSSQQPLPASLGAHLIETYYRALDEAVAMRSARERQREEIGYVLPRPSAQPLRLVRERPRTD
jgi:hypothetical protein